MRTVLCNLLHFQFCLMPTAPDVHGTWYNGTWCHEIHSSGWVNLQSAWSSMFYENWEYKQFDPHHKPASVSLHTQNTQIRTCWDLTARNCDTEHWLCKCILILNIQLKKFRWVTSDLSWSITIFKPRHLDIFKIKDEKVKRVQAHRAFVFSSFSTKL